MPFRVLLCDFDGVLRHWPQAETRAAEARARLPEGALLRAAFAPHRLTPAIEGRTSDVEWRAAVARDLSELVPAPRAACAVEDWSRSAGQLDRNLLDSLRGLRPTCKLALATNATTRLDRDLERLGLAEAFDWVLNSSRLGVAKPESGFFTRALEGCGCSAAEALFVDESERNVVAATALGLRSHRFRGSLELIQWLRARGLSPKPQRRLAAEG